MISTDPRGPIRQVVKIERTPSIVLLSLSCGHISRAVTHFSYKVAADSHCFACGQEAKKAVDKRPDLN